MRGQRVNHIKASDALCEAPLKELRWEICRCPILTADYTGDYIEREIEGFMNGAGLFR